MKKINSSTIIAPTHFGRGIVDSNIRGEDGELLKSYQHWAAMIRRCYSPNLHARKPNYVGCTVSQEWLRFSNFKEWHNEHYVEGFHIDKDIVKDGNKIYCKEFCNFVPVRINTLIGSKLNLSKTTGVTMISSGKYKASLQANGENKYLGVFEKLDDALKEYSKAKSAEIFRVASEEFIGGRISRNVFLRLLAKEV